MSDKLLVSAKFIELTAENCRNDPKFDAKVCGAAMLTHGFALFFNCTIEEAERKVGAALAMLDAGFVHAMPSGKN
jgi:hypothetical protein